MFVRPWVGFSAILGILNLLIANSPNDAFPSGSPYITIEVVSATPRIEIARHCRIQSNKEPRKKIKTEEDEITKGAKLQQHKGMATTEGGAARLSTPSKAHTIPGTKFLIMVVIPSSKLDQFPFFTSEGVGDKSGILGSSENPLRTAFDQTKGLPSSELADEEWPTVKSDLWGELPANNQKKSIDYLHITLYNSNSRKKKTTSKGGKPMTTEASPEEATQEGDEDEDYDSGADFEEDNASTSSPVTTAQGPEKVMTLYIDSIEKLALLNMLRSTVSKTSGSRRTTATEEGPIETPKSTPVYFVVKLPSDFTFSKKAKTTVSPSVETVILYALKPTPTMAPRTAANLEEWFLPLSSSGDFRVQRYHTKPSSGGIEDVMVIAKWPKENFKSNESASNHFYPQTKEETKALLIEDIFPDKNTVVTQRGSTFERDSEEESFPNSRWATNLDPTTSIVSEGGSCGSEKMPGFQKAGKMPLSGEDIDPETLATPNVKKCLAKDGTYVSKPCFIQICVTVLLCMAI